MWTVCGCTGGGKLLVGGYLLDGGDLLDGAGLTGVWESTLLEEALCLIGHSVIRPGCA